jgi:hypothetical protein
MAASASSIFARGNLCVMTGRGSNWPPVRNRCIRCQVSYIFRPITPCDPFEYDFIGEIDRHSPLGMPSNARGRPAHGGQRLVQGRWHTGHFTDHVRPPTRFFEDDLAYVCFGG